MECKRCCDSRVKNHSQEHDGRVRGERGERRMSGGWGGKGRGKNATKGTEIDATRGKNARGGRGGKSD